jgi:hypothetical protein
MDRVSREFVGTTSVRASFDPKEFAGQSLPVITAEVLKTLREIAPGVSFFEQDAVETAAELMNAAGR